MEPIERALLDDVLASPGDDAARRIYADWLEDHGRPDRAEFIRQAIHGSRSGSVTDYYCLEGRWAVSNEERHDPVWLGSPGMVSLMPGIPSVHGMKVRSRNGFATAIGCTFQAWAEHGKAICAAQPVEAVEIDGATWQYGLDADGMATFRGEIEGVGWVEAREELYGLGRNVRVVGGAAMSDLADAILDHVAAHWPGQRNASPADAWAQAALIGWAKRSAASGPS